MDYIGEMTDDRSKTDSMIMRMMRTAMNNAHEKLHKAEGPIEILHEKMKFYEMGLFQVEGTLQIVEETDIIEDGIHEMMLSDLTETKERLLGKINVVELLIKEKDRQLKESRENEMKLRHVLELKERELFCLRSLERRNSELIHNFVINDQENADDAKVDDICQLKNSLDQQVWKIKQRLEEERMSLTSGLRNENFLVDFEPDAEVLDDEAEVEFDGDDHGSETKTMSESRSDQSTVMERMSSDIDSLKETLDLAFFKMQNVEIRPLEKQWRYGIEKNMFLILIEGFITDVQETFEAELMKRSKQVMLGQSNEHWSELINEITNLNQQVDALKGTNWVHVLESPNISVASAPTPIRRTSSEPILEVNFTEEMPEEDLESDESPYVARLIKNHESIIRSHQQQQLHWLNRKNSSHDRRGKQPNGLERQIQEVSVRLNSIMKWKDKLFDTKGIHWKNDFVQKKIPKPEIGYKKEKRISYDADLVSQIRKQKQDNEDLDLRAMIMEETYLILLRGLIEGIYLELHNYEAENFESKSFESQIREDVFCTVCTEAAKSVVCNHDYTSVKHQNDSAEVALLHDHIESSIREDVYAVFFREMVMECNEIVQEHMEESHVLAKSEKMSEENLSEEVPLAKKMDTIFVAGGETTLIEKLDTMLKCMEVEEHLMLMASSEIKQHSAHHDLVVSECEEVDERVTIEWLLTEDETTFSSVSNKLEKALRQLGTSKTLLVELECSLATAANDSEKNDGPMKPIMDVTPDTEQSICQLADNEVVQSPFHSVYLPLLEFLKVLTEFENAVDKRIQPNKLRLERVKDQLALVNQLAASRRQRELLYKKAFISRCHNLRTAESEVDFLGDQVDVLLGLLEKIYLVLDHYSPVLSRYFKVSQVLELIQKELYGRVVYTPNIL